MMPRFGKFLPILFLLGYAGLCLAQDQNLDELVQTLMLKSGLNKQIEQFPSLVHAGLDQRAQQSSQLPEPVVDLLHHAVDISFNAESLKLGVRESIKRDLDREDIRNVLEWLNSPPGEKITMLEEAASTPEAIAEMQTMAGQLSHDPARTATIKRLDNAIKATEFSMSLAQNLQAAVIIAMTSLVPSEVQPLVESVVKSVKKQVEKSSAQMKPIIEQQVLMSFLYTYRTLSDDELEKYIAFAETESARKYHSVISQGYNSVLTDASGKFGNVIGELIKESAIK
jgi:hypothetical protein